MLNRIYALPKKIVDRSKGRLYTLAHLVVFPAGTHRVITRKEFAFGFQIDSPSCLAQTI